jgi:hypothetical protein
MATCLDAGVGIASSFGLTRFMVSFLFGVQA